jgi:L-alanine-DL-glutamate epimerase-like enolase superfamily enzyme
VPTAPIDERDIAAVAVRVLREQGHAGAEYVMTGPESLTHAEQIATIGRAIGRDLRVEEMTRDEARDELMTAIDWGAAPVAARAAVISKLLDAWGAAAGHPAFMTSTVEEITGRPARTYFQWAVDHAPLFRAENQPDLVRNRPANA